MTSKHTYKVTYKVTYKETVEVFPFIKRREEKIKIPYSLPGWDRGCPR